MREINYEMDTPRLESGGNRVLQRLRWGGDWMYGELAAPLMARLAQHISNLESLQLMLSIVQESTVFDEVLAELANKRAVEEVNSEIAPIWYAVWIGVEPVHAIPALAARINSLSSDEEKSKFAMLCLTAIVGSRTARRCRQNYKTVEHHDYAERRGARVCSLLQFIVTSAEPQALSVLCRVPVVLCHQQLLHHEPHQPSHGA